MRFVCDSCRAQYMISDEKVGAKGVKVRCKKCGYVILVRRPQDTPSQPEAPSDATQVMQNPLADPALFGGSSEADSSEEKGGGGIDKLFGGVEEDEIGAVFDQVLSSGKHKSAATTDKKDNPFSDLGDSPDDRMSTRVLDAETVRKLTEEAATGSAGAGETTQVAAEPKSDPAKHDWFVAIDEKQVGPLPLDKVKQHWDEGEIGPDSLCWRAGFSDWLPLSEVAELTAVLAPQPKKPVIVPSASMEPSVGAVMNVPAEQGSGASRSARSDAPASGAASQEDVGWKPSAASALASLVQEEIAALAKPAAPAKRAPAPSAAPVLEKAADKPRGLLDIPSQEIHVPENLLKQQQDSASVPSAAPAGRAPLGGPDAPSTVGPAPYTTTFRSPGPQKSSKAVLYGGAAVLGVVLLLAGVMVWMMLQQNSKLEEIARKPVEAPVVVARNEPPAPTPAAPVAAKPEPAVEPAKAEAPRTEEPPPAEAKKEPEQHAEPEPKREAKRTTTATPPATASRREPPPEPAKPQPEPERRAEPSGGNDDDFDELFGGSKKSAKKPEEKKAAARAVYVPPAPGQQDLPERLGQSDIMQVVLSNRAALASCTAEQKQKDPGLSGTLVMRWTIQTNGRTSKISPQTDEFKRTHLATCIGGVIKGMKFPEHKEQGAPIDFPFKF